jgi:hypothetical protein
MNVRRGRELDRIVREIGDLIGDALTEGSYDFIEDIRPLTEAEARDVAQRVARDVERMVFGNWEYIQEQFADDDAEFRSGMSKAQDPLAEEEGGQS